MIHQLQLKNFKAWQNSGPVRLAPITLLLGTNSSGKSTLLQSLLLLKQTAMSPDRTLHLNLGGDGAAGFCDFGGFDDILSHGMAGPRQFELAFDFARPGGERVTAGAFACSYVRTASGAVAIQELSLSTVARRFRAIRRERGAYSIVLDDEPLPRAKGRHLAPERSIALPAEALALLGHDGAHLQDLSLATLRELQAIAYLGPLRRKAQRDHAWNKSRPGEIGSEGHEAVAALLSSALLKEGDQGATLHGVAHWLRKMGLAEQLQVRQVGRSSRYELRVEQDGVTANICDVGVGVAQVLPVLALAYFVPPGSTVLLEEPEIHLHPLAQAVLAEMFVEVSQARNVQFIVETHSEHLFRRMQTLVAQRRTNTGQCQMLFVERQGGHAVLRPLEVDAFGAVRNWPDHFFGDAVGEARAQAQARAERMREAGHG